MNFVKLYIGDYQRDTGHLSLSEHGAYLLMLQHYYATEKPLPVGKELCTLLRAQSKTDREAIAAVAAQFWRQTDAGLVNIRADEEIAKADHQRAVNRELGKKGGRPRKREPKSEHETESETDSLTELLNGHETDSLTESKPKGKPNRNPNHSQTPDKEQKPPDPSGRRELWSHAISLLLEQGTSEPSARSFIGLQCRDWSDDDVAAAFSAATGKANVRAYVRKFLEGRPKKSEQPAGVVFKHGQATIGGFVA